MSALISSILSAHYVPNPEAPVTTAQKQTYAEASTKVVAAAQGFDYAYRDVGSGTVPLVLLQHFRGNLDNWDPALVDALASNRRVVTFDNVGVGGTSGTTPNTVEQMAMGAIEFLDAMEFEQADILGFSIGSCVAQEIALTRPASVRNLILASAAPKGAAGMHGWAPWVIDAVGKETPEALFAALRRGGHLITLQEPPSQEMADKYGVTALFFVVTANRDRLARVADMIDTGKLKVSVAATFPLADGRAAYQSGASRRHRPGKTVLVVRD